MDEKLNSDSLRKETKNQFQKSMTASAAMPLHFLPNRGLILAHNKQGHCFSEEDYHRWAAYTSRVLQCQRMDFLSFNGIVPGLLSTIRYAREFAGLISLRGNAMGSTEGLAEAVLEGLNDVILCPSDLDHPDFALWLKACFDLSVSVRLQMVLPRGGSVDAERHVKLFIQYNVRSVTILLEDPFHEAEKCASSRDGQAVLDYCDFLAATLPARNMELNFVGIPPRFLSDTAAAYTQSTRAYQYNHLHYNQKAFTFARRLFSLSPSKARVILFLALKSAGFSISLTDRRSINKLFVYFPFLYKSFMSITRWLRSRFQTRLLRNRIASSHRSEIQDNTRGSFTAEEEDRALKLLALDRKDLSKTTVDKSDQDMVFPYYRDQFEAYLNKEAAYQSSLASEAQKFLCSTEPTRIYGEKEWGTDEAFVIPEYGAISWVTALPGKRVSTLLDKLEPPFMITVTVGGGIAELIGFQVAPYCDILCPMIDSRHTLTLFANKEGHYVLLRDGVPVEPVLLPGGNPPPHRLPTDVRLRIVAWDIDERITFSPPRLWKNLVESLSQQPAPVYSVVVFCTRFARRLSVALQCLAHQREFDINKLEVIVGYVPGLDATEDVLNSLHLTQPKLRLIHAPFPRQNSHSKGYVLNQCMDHASGSRIVLLDADTLLPPTLFSMLEKMDEHEAFIATRGRALLGAEMTAQVLQGEIHPWEAWDELLTAANEIRENEALGVPIGYFQCFDRECLQTVRYPEYDHFQGADYEFAINLRKHVGQEYRLDTLAIHLDHSGSQWLGAERHF
ncbi:MAG: glycosyltransferase [Candidatus Hydrogenedentales bacterium]